MGWEKNHQRECFVLFFLFGVCMCFAAFNNTRINSESLRVPWAQKLRIERGKMSKNKKQKD